MTSTPDRVASDSETWRQLVAATAAGGGLGALDGRPGWWPCLLTRASTPGHPVYRPAWGLLVTDYHPGLLALATALAGWVPGFDAFDLVNETVARAMEGLRTFTAENPLRVHAALWRWLRRILMRVALDALRKERSLRNLACDAAALHDAVGSDPEAEAEDVWAADRATADPDARILLRELGDALTDEEKLLVVRYFLDDATADEVATSLAEATGRAWTADGVRARLQRLLHKVAARFARTDPKGST